MWNSALSGVVLFCGVLTMQQPGRVTATKPILDAFNAMAEAIAEMFDRDSHGTRFPPEAREAIFEKVKEVRSGMLAVIANRSGAHEGRAADMRKMLPNLDFLLRNTDDDAQVRRTILAYRKRIAQILPVVDLTTSAGKI